MATYNYKIWFKDSEIQEIMEDWGYQIKTVRMLLFDLFPEEKEEIRKKYISIISKSPLVHDISIACLIHLSTFSLVVLYF